ncbi:MULTISPECIES: SDR family NAD(P)-dependent oxidoreductase [unclassified Mesorhizobium]|uniref:SDR family NAD(P)-dependent oxidoreductase n=1 Tax=unclassified Mesorhizobium TaxID=325217 RepID=UPI00112D6B93|nr:MULTISPECIES: SDR family NAD(P)-dependent oxidoreductase [unclassified Mesorhizobium]TPJ40143.1 SDR family NAD(P)-dependent oxidoreductase [Mesorhizobium sp. B2-6-6]MCA0002447.1 SDR family NAD(P)-dependent oxidoreductase [Mesorhizobium sp. B264B2A]MCA0008357.1 SDR family NAD(P)-dependent oxidoreductase [Mesorhizobium sp. B264B1B]MCA0016932.1 SDR family NAD(P)-dependent oxidoreductase [Mesorhizobium sp. B264B1A]TPK62018.1 SDR family NAD(P)-dependent oxidoreductase [Mesorhizobium sp. B2-5-1]
MTDAKLAVVTGASSGIGKELAKLCAKDGYNLVVAADEPAIQQAAEALGSHNIAVEAVEADLATVEGVDRLISRISERDIDLLFLNAGRGLGNGFVDQDWGKIRRIIDTNITGTVYLAHELGAKMARRGRGRILFTGSIAGFMPGTFQAVYNGTKAFIDSFAIALRHELQDTGVTVTVLMPGATQTRFFERAEMMDTKVGTDEKDNPADVAKAGYEAMMTGEEQVVSGWKNKLQVAAAHVTPAGTLAEQHREMAAPGSASQD